MKKLKKVIVIGLGAWGQILTNKIHDKQIMDLIGVYDMDQSTSQKIAKNKKIISYKNFNEVISDPNADACILVTPIPTHTKLCLQLLKAKKHVLVAKPLAMSVTDCKLLIKTAKTNGVKLMCGHTTLFNAGLLKLKKLIKNKTITSIQIFREHPGRIIPGNTLYDLGVHDLANLLFLTEQKICKSQHIFFNYGNCQGIGSCIQIKLETTSAVISSSWQHPFKNRQTIIHTDGYIYVHDDIKGEINVYKITNENKILTETFKSTFLKKYDGLQNDSVFDELIYFSKIINNTKNADKNLQISQEVIKAISSSKLLS